MVAVSFNHPSRIQHGVTDRIWGNIRVILGLYGDNGKEDGNYYLGFRVYSPA